MESNVIPCVVVNIECPLGSQDYMQYAGRFAKLTAIIYTKLILSAACYFSTQSYHLVFNAAKVISFVSASEAPHKPHIDIQPGICIILICLKYLRGNTDAEEMDIECLYLLIYSTVCCKS